MRYVICGMLVGGWVWACGGAVQGPEPAPVERQSSVDAAAEIPPCDIGLTGICAGVWCTMPDGNTVRCETGDR